ncbi:MAG: hypothetical protein RL217_1160 [Pseudomonadota bacterium]
MADFSWLTQWHFIRPLWLLALLPVPFLLLLLWRSAQNASAWRKVIAPELLSAMLNEPSEKKYSSHWPLWLAAWLIAALALAGPTWQKLPQPIRKNDQALIILLDMSASMAAQDVKPSRYARSVQKITDILRQRQDGTTALIVYAGDAHTVTPLTDDRRTIETLLPALSPFIMPAMGSRPDKAVALARNLANQAGIQEANLLLFTDGMETKDSARIAAELRPGLQLKIIGLGSKEGAPIPLPESGFLRDGRGQIVLPQFDENAVKAIAEKIPAPYQALSLNDSDWQALLSAPIQKNSGKTKLFDLWLDQGFYLIFLLLPLCLLLFRRGALLVLALCVLLPTAPKSYAEESSPSLWQHAFSTQDQRAQALFEKNPASAAQQFQHPAWRASAFYRSGNYENAIKQYQALPKTADNRYNLGNALAQNGQFDAAIAAYDQALAMKNNFPQAIRNKKIVEDARKKQQSDKNSNDKKQNPDSQKQDPQNADSSDKNPSDKNQSEQNPSEQNQSKQNQPKQDPSDKNQSEQNQSEQNQSEQNQPKPDSEKNSQEPELNANQPQQDAHNEQEQQAVEPLPDAQNEGLSREEQENMQRWLKRVPDNPGNLLQRKFLYQYRQNQNDTEQGEVLW